MSEDSKKEILAGLDRPLRIGTRQSPLAMAQARMAANALLSTHAWRSEQVELVPMVASGDKILDRSLAEVGGKALWTKELDHALDNGEIDCSVHSMKDVETIRPEQFILAAMLERADIHDRLIGFDRGASGRRHRRHRLAAAQGTAAAAEKRSGYPADSRQCPDEAAENRGRRL